MLRSGKNGAVRTFVPACSACSQDLYQRDASGLYQQAFLTLGDSALAVHVVRDVIADGCALPPAPEFGEDDTRRRLAESVFRCCQQLAADRARRDGRPAALLRMALLRLATSSAAEAEDSSQGNRAQRGPATEAGEK